MDFYLHFPTQKMTLKKVTLSLVERRQLIPFAVPGVRVLKGSKLISQEIKVSDVHLWFHDFFIQESISIYIATEQNMHTLLLVQTDNPTALIEKQFPLIEGKSYLFYIPSNHPYSLELDAGKYHFFQIELSLLLLNKLANHNLTLQAMLKKIAQNPLEELLYHSGFVDAPMQNIIREIHDYMPIDFTERLFFLEEKIFQLMRYFSRQWTAERNETRIIQKKEQKMIDIASYIQSHLDHELNGALLAQKFNISERSLYRQFKVFHGLTLYRFILKERMEYAGFLLTQGRLNINEVVFLTGFQDSSTFRRTFKKYFKISPSGFIQKKGRK